MSDRAMSDRVATLLAQAREAHQRYRDALPQRRAADGAITPGDPVAARAALQTALDMRTAAIAEDPEQNDPAWQAEAASVYDHGALLTFYREQLARVP
jgi:hypothetical protein